MSFRLFILQLFNVRSKEVWLVKNLFSFKFLQGISVDFFYATALILFLKRFDIQTLPLIYIYSSLLLWTVGFLYTRAEHMLSIRQLVLSCILFMACTILILLSTFYYIKSFWIYLLLLSWFQVLYLVSGLEFWGLSSLLFDVRQSKRLFSMISAGDMVPKAIGFLALPGLILLIGGPNILLLSFGFMCLSLLYWKKFDRHGTFRVQMQHRHAANPGIRGIFENFFQNKLIFHLAIVSVIRVVMTTLISFCYLARVKLAAHNNHELDLFVITFLALGAILTVLMKTLFTGRIIAGMGIRKSMLLKPILLSIILTAIIIYSYLSPQGNTLLYLFGIAAVMNEVINYAILIPLLLSLMQPLPSDLRLKAHTLVKGIMDPLALLLSGIFLYLMYKYEGNLNLVHLCYVLLGLGIIWMIMVVRVEREYLKELTSALKKKYLRGVDLEIRDEGTMQLFEETMERGDETGSIFILGMVEKYYEPALDKLVLKGLASHSENIQSAALEIIEKKHILQAYEPVKHIMNKGKEEMKLKAMKTLFTLQNTDNLEDNPNWELNPEMLELKLVSMLKYKPDKQSALSKISELMEGGTDEERIIVARTLGAVHIPQGPDWLFQLLKDDQPDVVNAAIQSLPTHPGNPILQILEEKFSHRHSKELFLAICKCGESGLRFLKTYFSGAGIDRKTMITYIRLCGTESNLHTHVVLQDWLDSQPGHHKEILQALRQSKVKLNKQDEARYLHWCNFYLARGINMLDLMHRIMILEKDKRIITAIMNDLDLVIEKLLLLFSLLYDEDKIVRVQHGLNSGRKDAMANAMEIIELSVKKEQAKAFISLVEKKHLLKEGDLRSHYSGPEAGEGDFIRNILEDDGFVITRWTQAILMYTLSGPEISQHIPLIKKYAATGDNLLSETATFVLSKQG